ncbi:MAG: response regulator [Planctomycetes bacterium]|nr:response regulator [Planctomycetota bacterium]
MRRVVDENGFVVDVAGTGDDGLALASTGTYDLVILDVMLPGRDGWAVLATPAPHPSPQPECF